MHKKKHLKKGDLYFTDANRIDMARPENFNPGPGTYFPNSSSSRITLTTKIDNSQILTSI
jgi:hypothetical protein